MAAGGPVRKKEEVKERMDVLPCGTLPVLSPLARKLVFSPWEVRGLLYSVLSTAHLGCFSVPRATLQKRYEQINSEINHQNGVRTETLHLSQCWLKE